MEKKCKNTLLLMYAMTQLICSQGDSGGPLVFERKTASYELIGEKLI